MSKNRGPIKGVRVPVKLPWKGVAHEDDQFVSMKKPVANYLRIEIAKEKDLTYEGTIRYKSRDDKGNPTGNFKTKTVARTRIPGYRQRAIKVIFGDRKTGQRKPHGGVDSIKRDSFNFPVTRSVSITEIRDEFINGKWSSLPVVRIEDANSGQGYPIY